MPILSFFKKQIMKKSRLILGSLLFFVLTSSCSQDLSKYGRVNLHGKDSKNFTFFVSEEYLKKYPQSKLDPDNPKMTKAESTLLLNLLESNKFCENKNGDIFFRITSKQEKIYDMTFAHLIEQNYNARPVTPLMYYGECLSKPNTKKEVVKQLIEETKAVIKD
ncbi:MAG: hypothetical protein EBS06_07380 [Proteobacteria bacterium]|nr:hypothetical protein [Pseudomonadota bacterium]